VEQVRTEVGTPGPAVADADVLVVDDDPDVRASMAAVLESGGLSVLEAVDGETALRVLEHSRVAVVVLDLHMSPRDGVWLLERLKTPPAVIIVSAFSLYDRDAVLSRFSDVVAHAMQKPVAPPALIDAVRRSLGRHRP
jgi:CheY-like chemotaxis protein